MGRDFTLFALKNGQVKYAKSGSRTIVSIVAGAATA
jgi:ribosomal protein L27